jgi:FtsH-binding integral membrane protein
MKKMISQSSFHRMLYVAMGLTIAVAAIVVLLIIDPTTIPENYVRHMWTKVVVHLLVVIALLWSLKSEKQGNNRKEVQILAGVTLIILGIIWMDHAAGFHSRPRHEQPLAVSLWLFICAGCDIVTGLYILIARIFLKFSPFQSK